MIPVRNVKQHLYAFTLLAAAAGEMTTVKPQAKRWDNPTPYVGRLAGRNEPCPCGSGKKYKKCCMRKAGA